MNHIFKINLLIVLIVLLSGCSKQYKIPLIRNGKTTYSIYIDPYAPESVKKAAEDLKNYFIKISGISPEIIVAAEAPVSPFISLGNNSASKKAGLDVSSILNDGFRIVKG